MMSLSRRLHWRGIAVLTATLPFAGLGAACRDSTPPVTPTAPAVSMAPNPRDLEPKTPGGVAVPDVLAPQLVRDLRTGAGGVDRLAQAIADHGAPAVPFAEALLASPSVDDVCIGLRVLSLLAGLDGTKVQAPPTLGALIEHTAPSIREQALALANALEAVGPLIPRLNAPTGVPLTEKLQIARLAARWPGPEVINALTRCVLEASSAPLAEVCAISLTTPEHSALLTQPTHAAQRQALAAAGATLAHLLVTEEMPALIDPSILVGATTGDDPEVAALAVRLTTGAGEARGDLTIPQLYHKDSRAAVRRSIADYSVDLERVRALTGDDDATVRAAAIGNLARLTPSEERAAQLRPFLTHVDASTRLAAIASLAALAPLKDAVAALSTYLGDAPEAEQPVILAALRTIPDAQAVDALIAALNKASTRPAAWYALISLTGEEPGGEDPEFWRRWRDTRYGPQAPAPDAPPPADHDAPKTP